MCPSAEPEANSSRRSVAARLDPAVAAAWFAAVAAVRTEIALWTARQNKHAAVGYPLLTVLVCLEDDVGFAAHSDALVDALHRQLRDKLLRTAMLGCLVALVRTHLLRYAGAAPQGRTDAWLARATRPVLTHLRKGNLQFAEQQDAVVELCVAVAAREPNFGVGMVAELLAGEPTAWDAVGVGLRALRAILLTAPGRTAGAESAGEDAQARALLEMVKAGESPLGALGVAALAPRLGHALARVLQACANLFGAYRVTSPPRVLAELLPKERAAGLPVLAAALACVPFLLPEHWEDARLAAELPGALLLCVLSFWMFLAPSGTSPSNWLQLMVRLSLGLVKLKDFLAGWSPRLNERRTQATRSTQTRRCARRPRRRCCAACSRCPSCATSCYWRPPICWRACRTTSLTCGPWPSSCTHCWQPGLVLMLIDWGLM